MTLFHLHPNTNKLRPVNHLFTNHKKHYHRGDTIPNNQQNPLITTINTLKHTQIKHQIDHKINTFKNIPKNCPTTLFQELCFCILTANFNSERTIQIQQTIGHLFPSATCTELTHHLKTIGYRFPNIRAHYISETQTQKDHLPTILNTFKGEQLRTWLVQHIKGLGYKEASHFLRNIGYDDYAVIDFHIIDILAKHGYIQKPQTVTKKRYLEIEQILKNIAQTCNLTLAQLDFYLWYLETGKILK